MAASACWHTPMTRATQHDSSCVTRACRRGSIRHRWRPTSRACRARSSSAPGSPIRAGTPRASKGFADLAPALAAFGGARDVLALNGREPSGHGVWLGALLPRRASPAPRKIERLTRLATHLATAYRARRQLDRRRALDEQAEAVLCPDGRVEHAEGDARDASARDALRRATLRLDRARASTRREDADLALGLWKGMVDARWTLLDHFDHDGRRYVVARRNDPAVNPIGELTLRERQVVAYAALGHDNKVIAYELGLATATVRVLIHRASLKLGVRGRAELIEKVKGAPRAPLPPPSAPRSPRRR